MGKKCTVTFENVAVSAAQDLISIKAASTKPIRILRYWVGATDTTLPTSQMLNLRARSATATLTAGSGGGAATPIAIDVTNTTTVSATARKNDTTGATTSGAFTIVDEQGVHVYNGYDSAIQGRDPVDIPISGGFVWELLSTPTGTLHLSGGVDFEEVG
jgi:hypothetical protein